MSVTPAGWYPDPRDPNQVRYWDGQAWSDSTAPAAPPAPATPAPPPTAYPSYSSYPTYPAGQPGMANPYVQEKPSNTLSIIGIICGAVALIFCPFVLGIAGLVLGGVAKSKNEPLANVALVVSGIGLVAGIIISVAVINSMGV